MARYRLTDEGRAQLAALLAADSLERDALGYRIGGAGHKLGIAGWPIALPDEFVERARPAEPGPGVYQMGEHIVIRHPDDETDNCWTVVVPGSLGGVAWRNWQQVCDLYPGVEPVVRWDPDMPSTVDESPTVVWACTEPGCTAHIAYPREQGDGGMVLEHMEAHMEAHLLDRDEEPPDGSVVHVTYETGDTCVAERDDTTARNSGRAKPVHWYRNDEDEDCDEGPCSWHGLTKGAVRIALMVPDRVWEASAC